MLTRESLLTLLTPVTDELGLKVFDIDLPSSKSSVLRIYITRASLADADEDPFRFLTSVDHLTDRSRR